MAMMFMYACSQMTWELHKVGEEITFHIFILIYINNTKCKIFPRFECSSLIIKIQKNN